MFDFDVAFYVIFAVAYCVFGCVVITGGWLERFFWSENGHKGRMNREVVVIVNAHIWVGRRGGGRGGW